MRIILLVLAGTHCFTAVESLTHEKSGNRSGVGLPRGSADDKYNGTDAADGGNDDDDENENEKYDDDDDDEDDGKDDSDRMAQLNMELQVAEKKLDSNERRQSELKLSLKHYAGQKQSDAEIDGIANRAGIESGSPALGQMLARFWKDMRMFGVPVYTQHVQWELSNLTQKESELQSKVESLEKNIKSQRQEEDSESESKQEEELKPAGFQLPGGSGQTSAGADEIPSTLPGQGKRDWKVFIVAICIGCGVLYYSAHHGSQLHGAPSASASASQPNLIPPDLQDAIDNTLLHKESSKDRSSIRSILTSAITLAALVASVVSLQLLAGFEGVTCETGGQFSMLMAEVQFCHYTSAYIRTSSQVAFVCALLIVARNLIQQRFYYNMLKAGCVLDYTRCNPLKDSVFLMLLWWYGHMLMYLGFVSALQNWATSSMEEKVNQAFAVVQSSAAIAPFTLFIYLFIVAYKFDKTLAPLSEYIADGGDVSKVCAVDEAVAREVLLEQSMLSTSPLQEAMTDEAKFALIVQLCKERMKDPARKDTDPDKPTQLMTCLWPSKLLLTQMTQGKRSQVFRVFWRIFVVAAVLNLLQMFFNLMALFYKMVILEMSFVKVPVYGCCLYAMVQTLLKFGVSASKLPSIRKDLEFFAQERRELNEVMEKIGQLAEEAKAKLAEEQKTLATPPIGP